MLRISLIRCGPWARIGTTAILAYCCCFHGGGGEQQRQMLKAQNAVKTISGSSVSAMLIYNLVVTVSISITDVLPITFWLAAMGNHFDQKMTDFVYLLLCVQRFGLTNTCTCISGVCGQRKLEHLSQPTLLAWRFRIYRLMFHRSVNF